MSSPFLLLLFSAIVPLFILFYVSIVLPSAPFLSLSLDIWVCVCVPFFICKTDWYEFEKRPLSKKEAEAKVQFSHSHSKKKKKNTNNQTEKCIRLFSEEKHNTIYKTQFN